MRGEERVGERPARVRDGEPRGGERRGDGANRRLGTLGGGRVRSRRDDHRGDVGERTESSASGPATGSTGEDHARRAAARDEPFRRLRAERADAADDERRRRRGWIERRRRVVARRENERARSRGPAGRAHLAKGETRVRRGKNGERFGIFQIVREGFGVSRGVANRAREFVGGKVRGGGRANDDDVRSERRDGFVFFPRAIEPADDHESSPGASVASASASGRPAQIARRGRGASESSDADVQPARRSARVNAFVARHVGVRTTYVPTNESESRGRIGIFVRFRHPRERERGARRERRREVRRERRRESRGVFGGGDGRGRDATRLSHHHGGVQRTETEPDDAIPDGVNASRLRDDADERAERIRGTVSSRRRDAAEDVARDDDDADDASGDGAGWDVERFHRRAARAIAARDDRGERLRRADARRAESTPSGGEYFGRGAFGGGGFGGGDFGGGGFGVGVCRRSPNAIRLGCLRLRCLRCLRRGRVRRVPVYARNFLRDRSRHRV